MSTPLLSEADFHQAIANRADRWYSACLRITRNRDLAEDAVQDALLSAWQKRDQFQETAKLDTWIHRIAVNAALQLLRKQKPSRWQTLEEDVQGELANPEDEQNCDELDEQLVAALQGLSESERVCFVLKHIEQWRIREIAEELETTDGRVKQALFRGVAKLRESMQYLQREHA